MKTRHTAPVVLVALLALPAWMARGDDVQFQPAEDLELAKSFGFELSLEVDSVSLSVQGNDISGQIPDDATVDLEVLSQVVDHFVATDAGRPTELIRSFEEQTGAYEVSGGGESDSGEMEDIDELEGMSVRFKWDEEAEEYEVAFHDSDGDEELLESLGVDMDFLSLLPDDDVSADDEWDLTWQQVAQALFSGTDFDKVDWQEEADGDEDAMMILEELVPQFEALADEFSQSAEYRGRRTVDDVEVGVIALRVSGEGEIDLSGLIETLLTSQVPPEMELDLDIAEAGLFVSLEGDGELLWDLKAGHFHSMEMDADLELGIGVELEASVAGQVFPIEGDIEASGEASWSAATE